MKVYYDKHWNEAGPIEKFFGLLTRTRFHEFDSLEDYAQNYNKKFHSLRDHYWVKDVEITDLDNYQTSDGNTFSLSLKSGDREIKGIARTQVIQDEDMWYLAVPMGLGVPSFGFKWETYGGDLLRAKQGDNVVIGGYYYELNSALKGAEIPIRSLKIQR